MRGRIWWAYFRRWVYLLVWGMWRGEQAYTIYDRMGQVEIAAGKDFTQTTYVQTKSFYSGKL